MDDPNAIRSEAEKELYRKERINELVTDGQLLSAATMTRPRPKAMVIKKWLEHLGIGYMNGESGTFKTVIAMTMCLAIATGKEWFGFKTMQMNVLYVCGEGGLASIVNRFIGVSKQMGIPLPLNLYILMGRQFWNASRGEWQDVDTIEYIIEEKQIGFLVWDTQSSLFPGMRENESTDIQALLAGTRRLRDQYSVTILLLHHRNRSGSYRGSSAQFADVDQFLNVEFLKDQAKRAVRVSTRPEDDGKDKNGEGHAINLRRVIVDLGEVDDDGEPITAVMLDAFEPPRVDTLVEKLLKIVQDSYPESRSKAELERATTGLVPMDDAEKRKHADSVGKTMNRLAQEGKVTKQTEGRKVSYTWVPAS